MELFAQETSAQSKAARVEEWRRLSLESESQLQTWWNDKAQALKALKAQDEPHETTLQPPHAQGPGGPWLDEDELPETRMTPQGSSPASWTIRRDVAGASPETMPAFDPVPDATDNMTMYSPQSRDFALEQAMPGSRRALQGGQSRANTNNVQGSTPMPWTSRSSGVQWDKYF